MISKTRLYHITKGKHSRKEFADGTPVTAENKRREGGSPRLVIYAASGRNEIRLTEEQAQSPQLAHLGLVPVIGGAVVNTTKAAKPETDTPTPAATTPTGGAGEPAKTVVIPDDWQSLKVAEKRNIVAEITGKPADKMKTADADAVIDAYLAAKALDDVAQ